MKAIKALLFDLGGVIIDFDFNQAVDCWADYAQRNAMEIKSAFSFDHYYEAHEKGEINASEYFNSLRRTLGIDISDLQFEEGWNSIFKGEMPGATNLLNKFNNKLPLYAFTNSNHLHYKVCSVRFAETLSRFRKVFNSAELGKRKPEPEAFHMVVDFMKLKPEEIIFYDDTMENIVGAKNIGFHTVHVKSMSDIEESLKHFTLL
ncbi:MAG: HAD family phosphatase [Desulfobacteraceae bacterium]|jgi:putative hydrolase of the HAD superfamily